MPFTLGSDMSFLPQANAISDRQFADNLAFIPTADLSLNPSSNSPSKSLLFIDAGVDDIQTLANGAIAGTKVHVLRSGEDAIAQITQTLLGRSGIESLQIVSHGKSGGLQLGASWLDVQNLPSYVGQLKSWGAALTESADLLLYGCNVGADASGQAFVSLLAQATGANVAASDDLTGRDGDWDLEVKTGLIKTGLEIEPMRLSQYKGKLALTADTSLTLPGVNNSSVAWGDYSGDGKLDLILTGNSSSGRISQLYQDVPPPNTVPVVALPSGAIAYTENATAIVLDAAATVVDTSANFDTGTLTVSYTAGGSDSDRLAIRNQGTGAGQISLDGRKVLYGNTQIGTYTGGSGTDNLVITFNAAATPAATQALVQNLTYANVSDNPNILPRTVQLILTDGDGGTSTATTKTINLTSSNDAALIGRREVLSNGTAAPDTQGWTNSTAGSTATTSGGVTTLTTTPAVPYAGYSRTDRVLDATAGFVLEFQANVLTETLTATADKNADGKTDRANFSLTLVTSDNTKAIELGFTKTVGGLRIFAQEDGMSQVDTTLAPDAANPTRQLFTQAEGIDIANPGLGNYQIYIKDNSYTLLLNGTAILSGNLRNYKSFTGAPDPYETANLIAFSDNTTSASGSFSLGTVTLLNGGITDQIINEDTATTALTFGTFDIEGNAVTVSASSSNTAVATNANVVTAGTGASRTVTVTPISNASGTSNITLTANDGITNSTDVFAVAVNPVNDGTTDLALSGTAIDENVIAGIVGDITVTDPDTQTAFLNNVVTVDDARFEVVNNSGTLQLKLKAGEFFDFETTPSVTVNLTATDGSLTYAEAFTLTVNDVNEAPTALSLANVVNTIAENTDTTTRLKVADLNLVDIDGGSNTFELTGTDRDNFEIDGTVLYLKAGTVLNFEARMVRQTIDNWATDLTQPGYAAGSRYVVTVDRPERFAQLPTLSATGQLTYEAKPYVNVNALVNLTIQVQQDDGTIDANLTKTATLNIRYKPEALIRNSATNEVGLLYIDQVTQLQAQRNLTQAGQNVKLTPEWAIADTADFNRDGIADILLHNQSGDEVSMWMMGANGQVMATHSLQGQDGNILKTGNLNWKVVGFADIDRDNVLDIVWHNQVSDETAFWFMAANGSNVKSYDYLRDGGGNILKTGNPLWQAKAIADFDGDGDGDLLFQLKELNGAHHHRRDRRCNRLWRNESG